MENIGKLSSLKPEQKEAIALLSIGTFLEYFDLMLYVHMAVLLNELFFPKTDPFTASLLSAFAFCSTYVLRPFGALIFGYIGDNVGRKATVVITTSMMSFSCFLMANLPTYAQIGITASWIITICRMIQGLSSMGEVICANIYITEITKPPVQYPAVALMAISGALGGSCALGIASLVTSIDFNWRAAFWFGSIVAIIGAVARTRLRETIEFIDAKRRIKKVMSITNQNLESLENNSMWKERVTKKTALALFAVECSWPVCFYLAYIYLGNMLKNSFHLTSEEVIHQNFIVSLIQLSSWVILAYVSYRIYPLKILRFKLVIFLAFMIICPFLLEHATSTYHILLIQIYIAIFGFMGTPAMPIFYKHLPIFRRFTYATFTYALSRAFIYIITSFGLVYCTNFLGNWGILVIIFPTAIFFHYGLEHFENLEKTTNNRTF